MTSRAEGKVLFSIFRDHTRPFTQKEFFNALNKNMVDVSVDKTLHVIEMRSEDIRALTASPDNLVALGASRPYTYWLFGFEIIPAHLPFSVLCTLRERTLEETLLLQADKNDEE